MFYTIITMEGSLQIKVDPSENSFLSYDETIVFWRSGLFWNDNADRDPEWFNESENGCNYMRCPSQLPDVNTTERLWLLLYPCVRKPSKRENNGASIVPVEFQSLSLNQVCHMLLNNLRLRFGPSFQLSLSF